MGIQPAVKPDIPGSERQSSKDDKAKHEILSFRNLLIRMRLHSLTDKVTIGKGRQQVPANHVEVRTAARTRCDLGTFYTNLPFGKRI